MNWIKYIFIVIILFLLAGFYFLFYPKIPIIAGYAAREVCSCTFISNRDKESIVSEDINFPPISLAETVIDKKNRSVSATVFGLKKRTAYYHDGYGCVLDNDNDPTNNDIDYAPPRKVSSTTTGQYWPYGSSVKDTVFKNVDYKKLNNAINLVFDNGSEEILKSRSVLVVYKDNIIAERYSDGFDKNSPMTGWSMNKSVLHALYGILVKERGFDIYKTASIDSWKTDSRRDITIHDLLQMNSGLKWDENYNGLSDVTKMLFMAKDVSVSQMNKNADSKPQTHFNYSSGTSNLLSKILRKQFNTQDEYLNFPYKMLFNKLGMNSMVWETDMSGNYIVSSYGFASTRDWAKFGLLYKNDGVWNGEQILPSGWSKYAATPNGTSDGEYGSHFWLNAGGIFPDVPRDMYSANGHNGQRVFILPSNDLVIVRTGYGSLTKETINELISKIISSL